MALASWGPSFFMSQIPLSTSTCRIPRPSGTRPLGHDAPEPRVGDVVLVEVARPGAAYCDPGIEIRGDAGGPGTLLPLTRGARFFAAIGRREAEEALDATLPGSWAQELDLVAACGLIGEVTTNHWDLAPARMTVLGAAVDALGRLINTADHPLPDLPEPGACEAAEATRLVVFVADRMNAGKSTAVAAGVEALAARGVPVAAGRITGTANRQGLERLRDAGARAVADFSDLGHPTTVGLEASRTEEVLARTHAWLARQVPGGCVLLELADGFAQRETSMALHSDWMRKHVDAVVLCASGRETVADVVRRFEHAVALPLAAISGRAARDPGAAAAAGCPAFDARTVDGARLAPLLLGP